MCACGLGAPRQTRYLGILSEFCTQPDEHHSGGFESGKTASFAYQVNRVDLRRGTQQENPYNLYTTFENLWEGIRLIFLMFTPFFFSSLLAGNNKISNWYQK